MKAPTGVGMNIKDNPYKEPFPEARELKTHNHLLGDYVSLASAWEQDGYWFFRDILDKDALDRLRQSWLDVLTSERVIDGTHAASSKGVRYNGGSLKRFPHRMEPIAALAPWRAFVSEKSIHDMFVRILGDEPFWVPVVEYRATPPQVNRSKSRINGIHQDGPYSPGIDFRICWVPLAEINSDTGGLALAEGMAATRTNYHTTKEGGSNSHIRPQDIPANRWRRTDYKPGDLLLMNPWTPHTGIDNWSNFFRLSMDLRVMGQSQICPVVGHIECISSEQISVRQDGSLRTLRLDGNTYIRNAVGQRLNGDEITDFFQPLSEVVVGFAGDRAILVRPPH